MRMLHLVLPLSLCACITTTLKSGAHHIDTAAAAYARGDYQQAEAEYALAMERSDDSPWVEAEVARGRGKVGIQRLRARLPELRGQTTPPAEAIATVQAERATLRGFGGDDALDAQLVIVVGEHADRWVAAEEARAAAGEVFGAAHAVTPLLASRDLPESVVARATKLRQAAAQAALARAQAAGTGHPLAQRFHQGHAAALGIGETADAAALLAPFVPAVTVALEAPAECELRAIEPSLARAGDARRASVQIQLATCATASTTTTSSDEATWTEQVLRGYDAVLVSEQVCEPRCGSVLSGGETCNTNYNTSPPSLLCTKNTITKCFDECRTVEVSRQVPRFEAEDRRAPRTLTTVTTTVDASGTWRVVRDGAERTGSLAISDRNEYATAPAVGDAAPKAVGTPRSETELARAATDAARATIQAAIDGLFAAEAEAATSAASAASATGRIDDEEEAWARAVLLGGTDLGPLAARYDLDRAGFIDMFRAQRFAAQPADALPAPTEFPRLPRDDHGVITRDDLDTLALAKLPTFGGRYWLQVDGAYRSLPSVTTSGGGTAGGDSAILVGVRAATRVLDRKPSYWGWRLADELSASIALGGRVGGPPVVDNALSSFAATVSGHYALGGGYRVAGKGALFGGVRASYEAFLLGSSTGSYVAAPLFIRAEAPLVQGTVAVELTGASLLGASQWGLAVHVANRRQRDRERLKYVQLRIERATVDATSTDFGDATAMNGERMLAAVELTSVNVMYGVGW